MSYTSDDARERAEAIYQRLMREMRADLERTLRRRSLDGDRRELRCAAGDAPADRTRR